MVRRYSILYRGRGRRTNFSGSTTALLNSTNTTNQNHLLGWSFGRVWEEIKERCWSFGTHCQNLGRLAVAASARWDIISISIYPRRLRRFSPAQSFHCHRRTRTDAPLGNITPFDRARNLVWQMMAAAVLLGATLEVHEDNETLQEHCIDFFYHFK